MPDFLSPEVVVQERASSAVVVRQEPSAQLYMLSTAERGPINRPTLTISPDDWASIFGGDDGGDGFQSMVGFFGNGGSQILQNRVARYTDITDPATLTAVAAQVTLNTAGTAATAAVKTLSGFPWDMSVAAGVSSPIELTVSIDGAGADTAQLAATESTVVAAGAVAGVGVTNDTLVFSVNGVTLTYTVPATPPTSADEWAVSLAAQLPGTYWTQAAGVLTGHTFLRGTAAIINYTSQTGTAGVQSGFGAGPIAGTAGTGDVARDDAVTSAEVSAVLLTDWTGSSGVTTVVTATTVEVTSGTTGSSSSIGAISGSGVSSPDYTVDVPGLASGQDAGGPTVATMDVLAASEGAHGNELSVSTTRSDRVVATVSADLLAVPITEMTVDNANQFRVGMQIHVEDTTTTGEFRAIVSQIIGTRIIFSASVTPTAAVTAANSPTVTKETFSLTYLVAGSVSSVFSDLSMSPLDTTYYVGNVVGLDPLVLDPRQRIYISDNALTASATQDPRPIDYTSEPLAGGVDSSPLTDNDYIGSAVSSLGLNAADTEDSFSIAIIPGIETTATHNGLLDYAASREDHVALMDMPEGLTPTASVTYKNVTANLFGTYGIGFVGRPRVLRQSTGVVEDFPSVGYVAGMYARNDRENNIASPPAGPRKGQLRGTVGIANDNLYKRKGNRDIVYPEGLNPIFSREGSGVVVWGQNTLDPTSDRGAVGVRRAFISIRKTLLRLSEFVLFEINNADLRGDFRDITTGYLREQKRLGVIQGETDADSFYIICDETNNGAAVVNARKFNARIGVNVLPGIDFATIEIERDTRALDAELAAA